MGCNKAGIATDCTEANVPGPRAVTFRPASLSCLLGTIAGTGKSSLVCALCVGMAGSTKVSLGTGGSRWLGERKCSAHALRGLASQCSCSRCVPRAVRAGATGCFPLCWLPAPILQGILLRHAEHTWHSVLAAVHPAHSLPASLRLTIKHPHCVQRHLCHHRGLGARTTWATTCAGTAALRGRRSR